MPARRKTAAPSPKKIAPRKTAGLTPGRIADRLHRTVCQDVTAARFLLGAIERQLPPDAAELKKQLEDVSAILGDSGLELRALIKELRAGTKRGPAI